MANYDFKCNDCENEFSVTMAMKDYVEPVCPECQGSCNKIYHVPNVTYKGDGWASKDFRIKNQMRAKNEILSAKQKERYGNGPTLVPNFKGEEVKSWTDVEKLSKEEKKANQPKTYSSPIILPESK